MPAISTASAAGLACVAMSLLTCAIASPQNAEGLRFSNPTALEDSSKYYSHIAIAPSGGKTIYIAGQGGLNKKKEVVPGKEAQIRQAFANVKAALESVGATGADVVSINVYFVGYTEADLGPLAEAERTLFTPGKMPTSTLIPVPRLALDSELFEITAVAVIYPK